MALSIYSSPASANPLTVYSETTSSTELISGSGVPTSDDYSRGTSTTSSSQERWTEYWPASGTAGVYGRTFACATLVFGNTFENDFSGRDDSSNVTFRNGGGRTYALEAHTSSNHLASVESESRLTVSTETFTVATGRSHSRETTYSAATNRGTSLDGDTLVSYTETRHSYTQRWTSENTDGGEVGGRTDLLTARSESSVASDGTTFRTFLTSIWDETDDHGSPTHSQTETEGETVTPQTNTLYVVPRYTLEAGYPSATSAFRRTTAFGGTNQATVSYVTHTQLTTTLTGGWGATTAVYSTTTGTTSLADSSLIRDTVTTQRPVTRTVWSGTTTATLATTQAGTTTANRTASVGETRSESRTLLLYALPWVTNDRAYSQGLAIFADTQAGEYLWRAPDVDGAFWDEGQITESVAYTEFSTSAFTTQAATSAMHDTETWQTEDVTFVAVSESQAVVAITTTAQAASVLGPVSVTVQGNATGSGSTTTAVQTFARTRTTTNVTVGYSGTEVRTVNGRVGQYVTEEVTGTRVATTTTGGAAVGWDGTSFGIITHHVLTTESFTYHATRAIPTIAHLSNTEAPSVVGSTGWSTSSAAGGSTIMARETWGRPTPLGRATSISRDYLRPAGPFVQSPHAAGWDSPAGLGYGGAEAWFPRVWVDGSTLAVPLFTPLTSSRATGASRYTYSYDFDASRLRGTSMVTNNSTATQTFTLSFNVPATVAPGLAATTAGGGNSMMSAGSVTSVLIGNCEAWGSGPPRGASTIGAGAYRATIESANTTSVGQGWGPYATVGAVGDTQARVEPGWAASNSTFSSSVRRSPQPDVLTTTHRNFTS